MHLEMSFPCSSERLTCLRPAAKNPQGGHFIPHPCFLFVLFTNLIPIRQQYIAKKMMQKMKTFKANQGSTADATGLKF